MNKTAVTYRSKFLYAIFAGLMFSSSGLYGQEGSLPMTSEQQERPVINHGVEPTEDGMRLWEEQSRADTEIKSDKGAAAISQPATPVKQDTQKVVGKTEDDDSVLSFNFLYYLFHKFKLSENVE